MSLPLRLVSCNLDTEHATLIWQRQQEFCNLAMISPQQSKGARAMLDMSRSDLASAAGIAERTLVDFERGARTPHANNLAAIQRALENAGVRFTDHGVELPPKVDPHVASAIDTISKAMDTD
ncbi:helix-turn-helix transcriptional regulator [Azospirillum sp. TSA2s]|uniref:helix-turn-helix domain-containing protein n=1 Tax=Azospirillum sp. TSA2s TaxID=709810 RepID=UPI001FFE6416|nr:helix-turn-helix transcriptional regulator [Azospirillum sp. TSA2s]